MIGQGSCLKISLPHTNTRSDSTSVIGDNTDDIDTIVEEISEPPLISIVEDNELLVVNMDNIVSEDLWS